MEEAEDVVADENIAEMMEPLLKSFDEMESHRESLLHDKSLLEVVKQHFCNIKMSLQKKFDELETKDRTFGDKKTEYRTLLAEREAAVTEKEQDLWDRLQELKDAAVSAIIEARKKYQPSLEKKRDSTNQELGALKAVIKCIEECQLQDEYPIDALQERIAQIEKTKGDEKRITYMTCILKKKPRVDGRNASQRTSITVQNRLKTPTVHDERARYYAGGGRYPYAYASPAYEVSGHVPFSHQTNAPWPHHYPDERVPPYIALSKYGNYMSPTVQSPGNYGNYMSSGIQQSASSKYGSYMGSSLPSSHQSYM